MVEDKEGSDSKIRALNVVVVEAEAVAVKVKVRTGPAHPPTSSSPRWEGTIWFIACQAS
jgi:hypothetical protein